MGDEIDQTLWVGNLNDKISEELLWELFMQAGPMANVKIATEKDGRKKNFAFVRFKHSLSVPYTINLMNGIRLHGNALRLQSRPGSVHDPTRQSKMNGSPGGFHRSHSTPEFGNKQWGPGTPPPSLMGPPGQFQFMTPDGRGPPGMTRGSTFPQGPGPDRSRSQDRNRESGGRYERSRSPQRRDRYDDRHRDSPSDGSDRYGRPPYNRGQDSGRSRSNSRNDRDLSGNSRNDRDFSPSQRGGAASEQDKQRHNVLAAQQMAMMTNSNRGNNSPWALAHSLHAYNQQDNMQPRKWQGNNRRKY